MDAKKKILFFWVLFSLALPAPARADETALFTTVPPDALIVLDLSGSMLWTPAGQTMYTVNNGSCGSTSNPFYSDPSTGNTQACNVDSYDTIPKYGNSTCSGAFYRSSRTGYTTDCSRVAIANRSIFKILDDNGDGTINSSDDTSLNVRIGYMRFYNCSGDETNGDYNSGCIRLRSALGTSYSSVWTQVSADTTDATGGTPLASALGEAKHYLDDNKAADNAKNCRQKFAILITDGADTYACSGSGAEDQSDQYKRRRETVAKAKALADAGYKVFVVGFGNAMPHWLTNTLNWAAYYGGTTNPQADNSGDVTAYSPSSVTSCQSSTTSHHNIGNDGDHYYATSNDPGEASLSGYAFLATSATDLDTALGQAIDIIRQAIYSFSVASVASSRTQTENYLYQAAFQPINLEPFWQGHLSKYNLNSDGSVGSLVWDAGAMLQDMDAGSRTINTYKAGALTAFTTANITRTDLGVATDALRNSTVGYIRGVAANNPDNWKLGDIFHSNPVTIGTPSAFFNDIRDANNAFASFRTNHARTTANGQEIITAGANDGQFHAFRSSDGNEVWSFIPPNFLSKLKNIAHASHPTGLTHQFFVDGPVTAADVWLGSGDGTSKNAADWKTVTVFGEGRGAGTTLWSSSSSCDSNFNATYTSTFSNYCGYYAFNISSTLSPAYLWRLSPSAGQAPYLGDPWSRMILGRVKIGGNEKWVGFLGGGYNAADCTGGGACDNRGKGFNVVDLSNGSILWSYNQGNDSTMDYSVPAAPAAVDTDNDGFVDTVYIGDLGGDVWRFNFCLQADGSTCNTANWSGGKLYQSSSGNVRPIYNTPSVSKDRNGNLWVFWGTGDKIDPTNTTTQDRFFAVKDTTRSGTRAIGNLVNVTSGTYTDSATGYGWYVSLGSQGEKVLADPTVFGGIVYFTTYTPTTSSNPCDQAGTGALYALNYSTSAGVFTTSGGGSGGSGGTVSRSMSVGVGIPTAPVISIRPGGVATLSADLYVTSSGGAGIDLATARVNYTPPTLASRTNIIFWKDRRIQ